MYELLDHAELTAPALIAAFDGWVSAGAAGTATADHIADGGDVIALFESDDLFDYRVNRPSLEFVDGIATEIGWPEVVMRHRNLDGRDLLVLTGPEPNWKWRAFSAQVADLAGELGVVQHVSLGGIPWAAPHTRPTIVVTTSSRPDLLGDDANHPQGELRVPASVVSAVAHALADRGIPTVGLWARVPHYVGGVYHPAVVTLVERLSRHLGVKIPLGSLVDDAQDQRRSLDEAVDEQEGITDVVTRLEALYDAQGEVASGEEIAAEIERFLIESADDDSN
ncbi:MAG: PAC2 family protein [Acidobacteria bacterium]|nr:PAC2 family protein [Acidobacteriota bacterium]